MGVTKKQIIRTLVNSWMNGVAHDNRVGLLWNGEASVVCSLVHHLRTSLEGKDDSLRLWHQVHYQKLYKSGRWGLIDLEICRTSPRDGLRSEYLSPDELIVSEHIAAVEVKYARTAGIEKDFEKLVSMKSKFPKVLPIFCYVDYTDAEPTPELAYLRSESDKHEICVFYGNTEPPLKWQIINKQYLRQSNVRRGSKAN